MQTNIKNWKEKRNLTIFKGLVWNRTFLRVFESRKNLCGKVRHQIQWGSAEQGEKVKTLSTVECTLGLTLCNIKYFTIKRKLISYDDKMKINVCTSLYHTWSKGGEWVWCRYYNTLGVWRRGRDVARRFDPSSTSDCRRYLRFGADPPTLMCSELERTWKNVVFTPRIISISG